MMATINGDNDYYYYYYYYYYYALPLTKFLCCTLVS